MSEATKKKRLQHSNWLVTINTNKSIMTGRETFTLDDGSTVTYPQLKERLSKAVDQILGTADGLRDIVVYTEGSVDDIELVELDASLEIGSKFHKLHSHASLGFSHRATIQLDYELLKVRFQQALGLEGISVNIKFYRNTHMTVRDYIHKYDVPPT